MVSQHSRYQLTIQQTSKFEPLLEVQVCSILLRCWEIEFGFEQINEFRVVYANEFDKYVRKIYSFNQTIRPTDISDECMES
mgnify:CR=1 FL=1